MFLISFNYTIYYNKIGGQIFYLRPTRWRAMDEHHLVRVKLCNIVVNSNPSLLLITPFTKTPLLNCVFLISFDYIIYYKKIGRTIFYLKI